MKFRRKRLNKQKKVFSFVYLHKKRNYCLCIKTIKARGGLMTAVGFAYSSIIMEALTVTRLWPLSVQVNSVMSQSEACPLNI